MHHDLFSLCQVAEDVEGFETYKDMDESRAVKDVEELKPAKDVVELKPANVVEELKPAKDGVALNLTKDFEELKLKLNTVDSKLKEVSFSHLDLSYSVVTMKSFFLILGVIILFERIFGEISEFKEPDRGIIWVEVYFLNMLKYVC